MGFTKTKTCQTDPHSRQAGRLKLWSSWVPERAGHQDRPSDDRHLHSDFDLESVPSSRERPCLTSCSTSEGLTFSSTYLHQKDQRALFVNLNGRKFFVSAVKCSVCHYSPQLISLHSFIHPSTRLQRFKDSTEMPHWLSVTGMIALGS
jgi:hypothetical protein